MTRFTAEVPVLVTEHEAAQHLGMSLKRVARLRQNGLLPYIPGRPVLLQLGDVHALEQHLRERALARLQAKVPVKLTGVQMGFRMLLKEKMRQMARRAREDDARRDAQARKGEETADDE
jgi:hypothetical protein